MTYSIIILYFFQFLGQTTPTHGKVVACYVAIWAKYRPSYGKFTLDNLKPQYCTHLIYAFAGLNRTTWEIQSLDRYADIEEDGIYLFEIKYYTHTHTSIYITKNVNIIITTIYKHKYNKCNNIYLYRNW